MSKRKPTHYETLGVKPNVKHHELTFVFDRQMSARRREDAPPDQKAETALRAAFEVLSDPDRREAYDRELAAARRKPSFGRKQGAIAAVFVVLVASGLAYYAMRRGPDPMAHARPVEQITNEASIAIARLQSVDMSGVSKSAGVAFAISEGVMIASCDHIAPNTQLSVNLTPRVVPARLTMTDETLGLCRIEVKGAGSWPLRVSPQEVRAGAVVYATAVNAVGEVSLKQAHVKAVMPAKGGREVQTTLDKSVSGAPLLDVQGQVVAVASGSRHVVLPRSWIEQPRASEPVASQPAASPSSAGGDPAAPIEHAPAGEVANPYDRGADPTATRRTVPKNSPISQERAEAMHKQFRPERKIPASQDP